MNNKFDRNAYGVICKIWFGNESKVYRSDELDDEEDYRNLMKKGGWGERPYKCKESKDWEWGTPRDYMRGMKADGKRIKLLLYDKYAKAITVDITVEPYKFYHCENICDEKDKKQKCFNYRNCFKRENLNVLKEPVSLKQIQDLEGFKSFTKVGDRNAYRLISENDYNLLVP